MKKILFAVSAFLLFSIATIAQKKVINDPNAQVRTVTGFHGIRVSNGIHLYLSQGNEETVAVSASDTEFRDRIKTEVVNGILKIYYDNEGRKWKDDWDKKKLKAYVSFKQIDELKGNSGVQVDVDGSIKAGELVMDFSSGAVFNGNIQVSKLNMQQNSGSEVNISGSAGTCKIDISSGGTFKGYDLQTDFSDVDISSGGSVRITVNKELSASASSGGEVHYKGTGVIRKISTSSGGEVTKR